MTYKEIDSIIDDWVRRHSLHHYTSAKDEEVRSVHIVDEKARTYQIWIDVPSEAGAVNVHACAWDFKKRKQDFEATICDLAICLENAYKTVLDWIGGEK